MPNDQGGELGFIIGGNAKQKQGTASAGEAKPVIDDVNRSIGFAFHVIVFAEPCLGATA
jgi:hypothetical protein